MLPWRPSRTTTRLPLQSHLERVVSLCCHDDHQSQLRWSQLSSQRTALVWLPWAASASSGLQLEGKSASSSSSQPFGSTVSLPPFPPCSLSSLFPLLPLPPSLPLLPPSLPLLPPSSHLLLPPHTPSLFSLHPHSATCVLELIPPPPHPITPSSLHPLTSSFLHPLTHPHPPQTNRSRRTCV